MLYKLHMEIYIYTYGISHDVIKCCKISQPPLGPMSPAWSCVSGFRLMAHLGPPPSLLFHAHHSLHMFTQLEVIQ